MKHGLWYAFGLIVAGSLGLAATPAAADSIGPYYATPSWDQTLPASTRFIVLSNMAGEAVLDRETGLVWEKSPITSTFPWLTALFTCNDRSTGNRKGWRLPTLQELASLVDPTKSAPALPAGHPFQNVQSALYWSATTEAADTSFAWDVDFFGHGQVVNASKSGGANVWCVRGGQGVDPQ